MSIKKIATAQYDITMHASWQTYVDKIEHWVTQAVAQEAKILVFPEYASMELTSLFSKNVIDSLTLQLHELQTLLPEFTSLYKSLAQKHNCIIVAGTFPVKLGDEYRNRCYIFHENGHVDYQDKIMMTRFEREDWIIHGANTISCFDTTYGRIGVCICYDSEFPLLARHCIEHGAEVIVVPSCTETATGYYRVKIGSQARALENQCYVIHSVLVGDASWNEALGVSTGAAAVYTPVDRGYPDDGVLAIGPRDDVRWVYAELNMEQMRDIRVTGQNFNNKDWAEHMQCRYATPNQSMQENSDADRSPGQKDTGKVGL